MAGPAFQGLPQRPDLIAVPGRVDTNLFETLTKALADPALPPPLHSAESISCETHFVRMRDGTVLATDVYRPPPERAPAVVLRTPYGRRSEENGYVPLIAALARQGYAVVAQDCRGTGESEPDHWDYYIFEQEDGQDLIDWIARQPWCDGFIGACGSSYNGQTQWGMATHPAMSAIAPTVSGLGAAVNTVRQYMFLNAYARVVGKGAGKAAQMPMTEMERHFEAETMAGGFFNDPLIPTLPERVSAYAPDVEIGDLPAAQRRLWRTYCGMHAQQRADFIKDILGVSEISSTDIDALAPIFGDNISHDAFSLPWSDPVELWASISAPPLMRTGWYDWGLNDALATWQHMRLHAPPAIRDHARLVITPHAHNRPGYQIGAEHAPELLCPPNMPHQLPLLLRWYACVRGDGFAGWPRVIYYLMGANEWRQSDDWPLPEAAEVALFAAANGALTLSPPTGEDGQDEYIYDPMDPTPTVGGNILSYLYTPGSVDVTLVQQRPDVLTYTSEALAADVDVVGPLKVFLHASSSAPDTDFAARLSDVFPDGRAIQIQSAIMRARFRNQTPSLLEPGQIHCFEIDLWATANRFKAGHRIRLDISSADFPHYYRNANLGGAPGTPQSAYQTIHRTGRHASCILLSTLQPVTFQTSMGQRHVG